MLTPEELRQLAGLIAAELPVPAKSPYLDVTEAAAYCRCAVRTIYNNRRFIERVPALRKLLFTRDALDKWLATRRRRRNNSGA